MMCSFTISTSAVIGSVDGSVSYNCLSIVYTAKLVVMTSTLLSVLQRKHIKI